MKARLLVLAGLIAASFTVAAQDEPARADTITGVWQTKSGGYVQIYDAGNSYAGKIVGSVDGEPRFDTKNPDPDKRGRPLLGVVILRGLQYDGDLTWVDGEVYSPRKGETYSVEATLLSPNRLELRAYVGITLFGKSQIWTPVPLDAPNLVNDLLVGKLGKQGIEQSQSARQGGAAVQ